MENLMKEQTKNVNQELENKDLVTVEKQNGFLNSSVGKIINTAIDLGLRWILPDFVENQIIDVKLN